ncbi:hypothetical protein BH09BAC1_BH09BAC1_15590 [soil metagenome]
MRPILLLSAMVVYTLQMHAQEIAVPPKDSAFTYKLYPNPAIDKVVLELPEISMAMLEIYNAQGQLVLGGPVLRGTNTININYLPAGIYMLRMESAKGSIVTERLIKQ